MDIPDRSGPAVALSSGTICPTSARVPCCIAPRHSPAKRRSAHLPESPDTTRTMACTPRRLDRLQALPRDAEVQRTHPGRHKARIYRRRDRRRRQPEGMADRAMWQIVE